MAQKSHSGEIIHPLAPAVGDVPASAVQPSAWQEAALLHRAAEPASHMPQAEAPMRQSVAHTPALSHPAAPVSGTVRRSMVSAAEIALFVEREPLLTERAAREVAKTGMIQQLANDVARRSGTPLSAESVWRLEVGKTTLVGRMDGKPRADQVVWAMPDGSVAAPAVRRDTERGATLRTRAPARIPPPPQVELVNREQAAKQEQELQEQRKLISEIRTHVETQEKIVGELQRNSSRPGWTQAEVKAITRDVLEQMNRQLRLERQRRGLD